jgi:hypothetical protein
MGNELSCCEPTPQGAFKNAPRSPRGISKQQAQSMVHDSVVGEAWPVKPDSVTNWGAKGVPAHFDAKSASESSSPAGRWGVVPVASFDSNGAYESQRQSLEPGYSSQVRGGDMGRDCDCARDVGGDGRGKVLAQVSACGRAARVRGPVTVSVSSCHCLPFSPPDLELQRSELSSTRTSRSQTRGDMLATFDAKFEYAVADSSKLCW